MKERPILFSAPMVRAILAGTKTQTRRLVEMKSHQQIEERDDGRPWPWMYDGERDADSWMACPYGQPGDQLWVRETFQGPLVPENDPYPDGMYSPKFCEYAADGGPAPEFVDADDRLMHRWKPSIHMPRWASRITLEIVSVRVERLHDISEADAMAEGVELGGPIGNLQAYLSGPYSYHYAQLWESINGYGSWETNPWVWVVEFKNLASKPNA